MSDVGDVKDRSDLGLLHILPQAEEHGDALIVGTPVALRAFRDAIDAALRDGVAVVAAGTMPTDGEGFWLTVHAVTPEQIEAVPLPYAEMRDGRDIPDWLYAASDSAVAAFLRQRRSPTSPIAPPPRDICQCGACSATVTHMSDCAVHNEYAARNGPCDCGAEPAPTHEGA